MNEPSNAEESLRDWLWYLLIACLLIAFYTMTRPLNHSESYDSITYALFAENYTLGTAPDSRNILFHVVNRSLFVTSEWLGLEFRPLELISFVSIVTGALSLVIFARLLKRRFGVSPFAAWTGASFLGLTYGFWRYAGAAEVYVPSIFLILCSLTLIFRFLDSKDRSQGTLIAAGILSGLSVLYYQPNIIVLFFATFVLFCSAKYFLAYVEFSIIGALVVIAGLVGSFMAIHGHVPSIADLTNFVGERNGEFRVHTDAHIALIKFVLAFGHDVFSAHWTRTLDPVRNTLDPLIPGCVYNFNVVVYAGKGIQYLTVIAAVLFVPALILFARIHWIAARQWKLSRPSKQTLFMICWLVMMGLIIGTIDPGSFEAWIPLLVPFVGLITVLAIEPCCELGKHRTLIAFLLVLFCYNFFGGAILWRNIEGDYFMHETAWINQELTATDTVVVNEFDYRLVDYLHYHGNARVAHLTGDDQITFDRSHPEIQSIPLEDFIDQYVSGPHKLFVMDSTLKPSPQIRSCRHGEEHYSAAIKLADLLKEHVVLVNSSEFGDTYEVKQPE